MKNKFQNVIKAYTEPSFLICVIVLAVSAGGMSFAIKKFGIYLTKEPLPLKRKLDRLDENGLGSYRIINKRQIDNKEVIKSLGTEDYIEWILEDTDADEHSPVRNCHLFITYYDRPDKVPHVPEECYTGSGYHLESSENVTLKLNSGPNAGVRDIYVKYLIFSNSGGQDIGGSDKLPIFYFFRVNDIYSRDRDQARAALYRNLFSKHSYFSKVEWKFFNKKYNFYPDKDQAIQAGSKLLSQILPILEDKHWPKLQRDDE